jgi:DNA primase
MISPSTISQVRDRADVVAVISEHVPSLKIRGRSFVGLCPFHKEKSPSFHVNRERGFYHCFGCKESGSVVDFVMRMEGATFPEAIRSLAERFGVTVEEEKTGDRSLEEGKRRQREDLFAANAVAAEFFERMLREHEHAQYGHDELAKRKLERGVDAAIDDALQAFRIGYAPAGWDELAQHFKTQGVSPTTAESAGLIVPRSSGTGYYDRFRHRLMFAVVDVQGRVIAFSGRALQELPGVEKKEGAKYINSPESPIYTKGAHLFGLYQARHAIRSEDEAVVVEGNFDVVALHARGVANVVAPLGTAFTSEQALLLRRFTANVTLLLDGDTAGRKAVTASREPLRLAKLSAKVAELPDGVDPDDYIRDKGADGLRTLLGRARGMLEALIENALDSAFSQADALERVRRVDQIAKLISEEEDPLTRSMAKTYADRLAGRLDLARSPDAFRALERKVKDALRTTQMETRYGGGEQARLKRTPLGSAQRREMIGALLDFPQLAEEPEVSAALNLFEGPAALLVAALGRMSHAGTDFQGDAYMQSLGDEIPKDIKGFVQSRLSAPVFEKEEEARRNLLENANRLKGLLLGEELIEIAKEQERGGPDNEMDRLREAESRARARHGLSGK